MYTNFEHFYFLYFLSSFFSLAFLLKKERKKVITKIVCKTIIAL